MFTPLNRGNLTLVACPLCGRTRSLSPVKSVLRFPSHEPRTIQAEVKDKRWSTTGKTDWDVAGRREDERQAQSSHETFSPLLS
jgi:hypothetical protein